MESYICNWNMHVKTAQVRINMKLSVAGELLHAFMHKPDGWSNTTRTEQLIEIYDKNIQSSNSFKFMSST